MTDVDTMNYTMSSAIESHITQCVILIQSVFRRWRDRKLIMNSYAQFEDLCKEVEHNINASFKFGFQRQYKTDVSFPIVGKVEIEDIMSGMKLFVNRDIFSPYASTAKSSLLHRQEHLSLQGSQPPILNKIIEQDFEPTSSLAKAPVKVTLPQQIEPTSVFNLTSVERSTSYHDEDILTDEQSNNDNGDRNDKSSSYSNNESEMEERSSTGIRSSSSAASRERVSAVDISISKDQKTSSHVDVDIAKSSLNETCSDKDIDIINSAKPTWNQMSIEELKQEEKWLEKAIIARIRYLRKDDENW